MVRGKFRGNYGISCYTPIIKNEMGKKNKAKQASKDRDFVGGKKRIWSAIPPASISFFSIFCYQRSGRSFQSKHTAICPRCINGEIGYDIYHLLCRIQHYG